MTRRVTDRERTQDSAPAVRALITARKALYATKRAREDPLRDDCLNRYEALGMVTEAFEYLEAEIATLLGEPLPGIGDGDP